MKLIAATVCVGIGVLLGICIGHAQAKDDYSTCWKAVQKLETLTERITACMPYLDREWRHTRKGWKQ